MTEVPLNSEDYQTIKAILHGYREGGTQNPLLPLDVDLNGDGLVDSFGLDENGEVIVVPGIELLKTVYESSDEEDVDVEVGDPLVEDAPPTW